MVRHANNGGGAEPVRRERRARKKRRLARLVPRREPIMTQGPKRGWPEVSTHSTSAVRWATLPGGTKPPHGPIRSIRRVPMAPTGAALTSGLRLDPRTLIWPTDTVAIYGVPDATRGCRRAPTILGQCTKTSRNPRCELGCPEDRHRSCPSLIGGFFPPIPVDDGSLHRHGP